MRCALLSLLSRTQYDIVERGVRVEEIASRYVRQPREGDHLEVVLWEDLGYQRVRGRVERVVGERDGLEGFTPFGILFGGRGRGHVVGGEVERTEGERGGWGAHACVRGHTRMCKGRLCEQRTAVRAKRGEQRAASSEWRA